MFPSIHPSSFHFLSLSFDRSTERERSAGPGNRLDIESDYRDEEIIKSVKKMINQRF